MRKDLYLNDVPVDVFLDYFDKTTYNDKNKNEQVWEDSNNIVMEPFLTHEFIVILNDNLDISFQQPKQGNASKYETISGKWGDYKDSEDYKDSLDIDSEINIDGFTYKIISETQAKATSIPDIISKKVSENKVYKKLVITASTEKIIDISFSEDDYRSYGIYTTEEAEEVIKTANYYKYDSLEDTLELEFINKHSDFNFSKMSSLFECYYKRENVPDSENETLSILMKIEPYKVPKVNDNGEYIYRDHQGLLTTKETYDNNFFTHQKALRKTFAGITENNSWMYRCNPRTLSIVNDKGKDYLSYYDQCIKTVKYELAPIEIKIDENTKVEYNGKDCTWDDENFIQNEDIELKDKDIIIYNFNKYIYSSGNFYSIIELEKDLKIKDENENEYIWVISEDDISEDAFLDSDLEKLNPDPNVSYSYFNGIEYENGYSWNGEILFKTEPENIAESAINVSYLNKNYLLEGTTLKNIIQDGSTVKYNNTSYTYNKNSKTLSIDSYSKEVIQKKKLGTTTREILKIENRLHSIEDYPKYNIYSTSKEAQLLEGPTTFYVDDDRYVNRESGFYSDGIENPEYLFSLQTDDEKVELPNKNLYFMNSPGFYCNNEKLELKEGMELIYNAEKYVYQVPGFYTKNKSYIDSDDTVDEEQWNIKLGLKDGLKCKFNSSNCSYYSDGFFKLDENTLIPNEYKKYNLKNDRLYYLNLNITSSEWPYIDTPNESEYIYKYNGLSNWCFSKVDNIPLLKQSKISEFAHEPTKMVLVNDIHNREHIWNGSLYYNETKLPKTTETVKYNGITWNIDFNNKKLYNEVNVDFTTIVTYNRRQYSWNGNDFITKSALKELPKGSENITFDGSEGWSWNGKYLIKNFLKVKEPELATQIYYKNTQCTLTEDNTWVDKNNTNINIENGDKIEYNGLEWKHKRDSDGNPYFEKLWVITVRPEPTTKISYDDSEYIWNGKKFLISAVRSNILPNNVEVSYKNVQCTYKNKELYFRIKLISSLNIFQSTNVEYEGTTYFYIGFNGFGSEYNFGFRSLFWKSLPSSKELEYKNIPGFSIEGEYLVKKIKPIVMPTISVYRGGLKFTWNGEKFETEDNRFMTLKAGNIVRYNGLDGWVWDGKKLYIFEYFYKNMSVVGNDGLTYTYYVYKRENYFRCISSISARSNQDAYFYGNYEYNSTLMHIDSCPNVSHSISSIVPRLPDKITGPDGKQYTYTKDEEKEKEGKKYFYFKNENGKRLSDSDIENEKDRITYKGISTYAYSENDGAPFIENTSNIELGTTIEASIDGTMKTLTWVGDSFKAFKEYRYNKSGIFYDSEGDIVSKDIILFMKEDSNNNIYKYKKSGFYGLGDDSSVDPILFENADSIYVNNIEYKYFEKEGFYYDFKTTELTSSGIKPLNLLPSLTVIHSGNIYTYRIGMLYYKEKLTLEENMEVEFDNVKYVYKKNTKGKHIPKNKFLDTENTILNFKNNLTVKIKDVYYTYLESDGCFYKRSQLTLGSIIYSPEIVSRKNVVSENIFMGADPEPEMVLLDVYERNVRIKSLPEYTLKLNDDDTVFIAYSISSTKDTVPNIDKISSEKYKNTIFDFKSIRPYILLPVFSDRDTLADNIGKYVKLEISTLEKLLVLNGEIKSSPLCLSDAEVDFDGDFIAEIICGSELGLNSEQQTILEGKNIDSVFFIKIELNKIETKLCRKMLCEISKAKENKIETLTYTGLTTKKITKTNYKIATNVWNTLFSKDTLPALEKQVDEEEQETTVKTANIAVTAYSDSKYRISDYLKFDLSNEPIEKFYNIINPSDNDITEYLEFGRKKLNNSNLKLDGAVFSEEEYYENYYSVDSVIKKTVSYEFLRSSQVLELNYNDGVSLERVLYKDKEYNIDKKNGISNVILKDVINMERTTQIMHENTLFRWDNSSRSFISNDSKRLNKNAVVYFADPMLKNNSIFKSEANPTGIELKSAVYKTKKTNSNNDYFSTKYYWDGVSFVNRKDLDSEVQDIIYENFTNCKLTNSQTNIKITEKLPKTKGSFHMYNYNDNGNLLENQKIYFKYNSKEFKYYAPASINNLSYQYGGKYFRKTWLSNLNCFKVYLDTISYPASIFYDGKNYDYDTITGKYINTYQYTKIASFFSKLFRSKWLYNLLVITIKTELKNDISIPIYTKNSGKLINTFNYKDGKFSAYDYSKSSFRVNGKLYVYDYELKCFCNDASGELNDDTIISYNNLKNFKIIDLVNGTLEKDIEVTRGTQIRHDNMYYSYSNNNEFITNTINKISLKTLSTALSVGDKTRLKEDDLNLVTKIMIDDVIYTYDGRSFVNDSNKTIVLDSNLKFLLFKPNYKYNYPNRSLFKNNEELEENRIKLITAKKIRVIYDDYIKPNKETIKNKPTEYIWDGIKFQNNVGGNLPESTSENQTLVKYQGVPGYLYINKSEDELNLTKTIKVDGTTKISYKIPPDNENSTNFIWNGEDFITDEKLSLGSEVIIMSTQDSGWEWDGTGFLKKGNKEYKITLNTMVVHNEKIYYYNGDEFIRNVPLMEIINEKGIDLSAGIDVNIEIEGSTSAYKWNGAYLYQDNNSEIIIPSLATAVYFEKEKGDGLTYTWDGYQFSFGDLDKYPSTKENPDFNVLDIEGMPFTKETIQTRYNNGGRYFVNEMSKLRGDFIGDSEFLEERINSLVTILKGIITNEEGEIHLKTESLKTNGFTNIYNYCQGVNTFVKKDVMLISDLIVPERKLKKNIDCRIILEKNIYEEPTEIETLSKTKISQKDNRPLLERIANYKKYPANFMYEDYLNKLLNSDTDVDKIFYNINIGIGEKADTYDYTKTYRNRIFNNLQTNILKEMLNIINSDNNSLKEHLLSTSEYYKKYYGRKIGNINDGYELNKIENDDNIKEKKVFLNNNDETDIILKNIMFGTTEDGIWEVLGEQFNET